MTKSILRNKSLAARKHSKARVLFAAGGVEIRLFEEQDLVLTDLKNCGHDHTWVYERELNHLRYSAKPLRAVPARSRPDDVVHTIAQPCLQAAGVPQNPPRVHCPVRACSADRYWRSYYKKDIQDTRFLLKNMCIELVEDILRLYKEEDSFGFESGDGYSSSDLYKSDDEN
jgi:hypothetical protein